MQMNRGKRERPKMAGTELTEDHNKIYVLNLATLSPMKEQWLIHYACFFNFPSIPSSSSSLNPLCSRCKKKNPHGIWLSSSLLVSLQLQFDHTAHEVVLTVSSQGKIYEEHNILELLFSWPQVLCMDECPTRGSRVVFASYRDSSGQVQKFAMRFSASSDSQAFISFLKEFLKDIRNSMLASSKFESEISSPSEFISSKGSHVRAAEELSNVNPVGNFEPPVQPPSNYGNMQYKCPEETILAHGSEATCATLPLSFTALLSEYCTAEKQGLPEVPEALYPKTQMVVGMTSSSFYDMLNTLEMVIEELGGDLAL